MGLVSIDMVDGVMVLVIEKNPAEIGVSLFHPGLETLNLCCILYIDDVLMDILERKLVAERVWLLWHRLPVLGQKRRYTTWDAPHQIILFLTLYFLFPILNNISLL